VQKVKFGSVFPEKSTKVWKELTTLLKFLKKNSKIFFFQTLILSRKSKLKDYQRANQIASDKMQTVRAKIPLKCVV